MSPSAPDPINSGPTRPRGVRVNSAVLAAQQIPPNKTIACFPEGIIINYLSRHRTPTPYVNFNPPDLLLFGEDRMLQSLADAPPDFIFLVHKDTSEFGEKFFGRDYGQKMYAWIQANYQQQDLPMLDLGGEPLVGDQFGIRLLIPKPPQEGQQRLIYGPINPGTGAASSLAADSVSTTRIDKNRMPTTSIGCLACSARLNLSTIQCRFPLSTQIRFSSPSRK